MRNEADDGSVMRVASDLLCFPLKYHNSNKSPIHLLADLDYLHWQSRLSEEVFQQALREAPQVMKSWAEWSEDKRTTNGWYILQESDPSNPLRVRYVVGYLDARSPGPLTHSHVQAYDDPVEAFAAFIKRELDSIAEHML